MEIKVVLQPDGNLGVYWPKDKPAATIKFLETALAAVKDAAAAEEMRPKIEVAAQLPAPLRARAVGGNNGM